MGLEILLSALALASSTPTTGNAVVGHSVHDRPIRMLCRAVSRHGRSLVTS